MLLFAPWLLPAEEMLDILKKLRILLTGEDK